MLIGAAVTIQSMVYGNMNVRSGSGIAFTRNPSCGMKELYGEYLPNAEVVNSIIINILNIIIIFICYI